MLEYNIAEFCIREAVGTLDFVRRVCKKLRSGWLREFYQEALWIWAYIRRYRLTVVIHVLLALLSTALVPALAEEMCFRGMLQGLLTRRLPRAGIWMTALAFAAVHLQWSALPALFVLGLALGYVNKRHGFWAGVLLHGLYNAAVLVLSSREIGITLPIVLVCTIAFIFAWRGLMQEEEPHNEADGTGL